MKILVMGIALAGIAATTPLSAQITVRNPTNSGNVDIGGNSGQWYSIGRDANGYSIYERRTRNANGDIVIQRARRNSNGSMTIVSTRTVRDDSNVSNTSGQWYSVGRDANGYSIYERRTRDRNGNIVVQRARRNSNGSMTIISTRTVRDGYDRRGRNCDYTRTTNSAGDILFGRVSDNLCDDEYSREDNGWYQVGRGPNNNSIYERRTRDGNGNLIIQRARRNRDGTMRIISTRRANDNDRQWRRVNRDRDDRWDDDRDDDRDDRWDDRDDRREDKWERKDEKREEKRERKDDKRDDRRDRKDDKRDNR